MRKFTKIALILVVVFGIIGVASLIAAATVGYARGDSVKIVEEKLPIIAKKVLKGHNKDAEPSAENREDGVVDITNISEQFQSMDIELGAGEVEIYYDDVQQVQVEQKSVKGFQCYVKEDELHVKGGYNVGVRQPDGKIIIRIPQGMAFSKFDIEVGVGSAKVEGIMAREMSADVDVGKAVITKLDAQDISAEVEVGELYMEIAGSVDDYSYEAECKGGSLQIGDRDESNTKQIVNNIHATRRLKAECGIGKLQIKFAK